MSVARTARRLARPGLHAARSLRWALLFQFAPALPRASKVPQETTDAARLRLEATRMVRGAASSTAAGAVLKVHGAYWSAKAVGSASVLVLRHGAAVRDRIGTARARQWKEALVLARRWNVTPRTYYLYRFWDPSIRPLAPQFLQDDEMLVLLGGLNREEQAQTLGDKVTFAERCAAAGLPTPPLVALCDGGGPGVAADALPRRDLFVKRKWGKQGEGAQRWVYEAAAESWSRRGEVLDADRLAGHLDRLGRRRPILVQQCLRNHPEIEQLGGPTLCTFRVMTYRGPDGVPTLMGLVLKLAPPSSDVDNFHAGGRICAVEPDTGRLGPAVSGTPGSIPVELDARTHLTTHREVIELALRAHRQLDVPWSVGWDVAMTEDGAVLLEGNPAWAVDLYHASHGVGLPPPFAHGMLTALQRGHGS